MWETLSASLPFCSVLIRPRSTNSLAALFLVLLGIFVTFEDKTISPPTCSHLNASNRTSKANCFVYALLDCRNTSTHRRGSFTHCASNGARFLFFGLTPDGVNS